MIVPLKVSNLEKVFTGKKILDLINFELRAGEIFGLIGLNGVGKTTLIKIILDLLKTDCGNVEIDGISSTNVNSRKNVRYLPEKFQVSSVMKGKEFLKIFNDFDKKQSLKGEDLENKIDRLSFLLSFDKKALNLRISKYSKGMVQKLGLISTFLTNSKLVILDEPMSGLDPIARVSLKNLLLDNKKQGKSIFLSSHILSDIDEICDKVGVLHNGKLVFLGTPDELKKKHSEIILEKAFLKEIIK
jgi:ABC-2 type transport system ATP-binding protein